MNSANNTTAITNILMSFLPNLATITCWVN